MKNILILGAGYTIKPMADYFIDHCGYQVVMATRTASKAEEVIAGRSGGKAVAWTTENEALLEQLVKESDMVMVMIPRSGHYRVAEACIRHGKPMITTDFMHEGIMAFDEEGQAVSFERKIEISERAYKILTEIVGLNPQDIIFDPNILTIATGMSEHDDYAVNYLKAIKDKYDFFT